MFGASELALARAILAGSADHRRSRVEQAVAGVARRLQTVGVRVPAHAVAQALAAAFGLCMTATSANLSGRSPALTADEVAAAFGTRIDAVIDAGPAPGGAPSTIVEVVNDRPVLAPRGAIAWDRVLKSLQ